MSQMKTIKKKNLVKIDKSKRISLRSKAQLRRNICRVEVVTEAGEILACKIVHRRGMI